MDMRVSSGRARPERASVPKVPQQSDRSRLGGQAENVHRLLDELRGLANHVALGHNLVRLLAKERILGVLRYEAGVLVTGIGLLLVNVLVGEVEIFVV